MLREELIFVGTCDIAGLVRGKGFPARELKARRKTQGIGWTHSNLMQTAFGPILDTPFGTGGDLMIVPDTELRGAASISATARRPSISSSATSATPTAALGSAARANSCAAPSQALDEASGPQPDRRLRAGVRLYRRRGSARAIAYSLGALRRQGTFGETLIAALRAAGAQARFVPAPNMARANTR